MVIDRHTDWETLNEAIHDPEALEIIDHYIVDCDGQGDEWEERERCINCSRPAGVDVCSLCGLPLCAMCWELGGGVCDMH